MSNFKVTNLDTGSFIVTNDAGFNGLIASHTSNMSGVLASLEAEIIRTDVNGTGWESQTRKMRIEKTNDAITHAF